jgi:predicted naringenin-chalcone synthase
MNFESLYEEHKWKQHYQQFLEQEQQSQIKTLSSSKKINERSSYILNNKLYEMLAKFRDEETINIETSVPLLFHIKILQVIQSIESAKVKL